MILNVVATPIGNLKDITLRAKEVLESATLLLAEDTRSTKKLLSLLGIALENKQYVSSHAQSSQGALQKALQGCVGHEVIALVTDAGTPAISDPGSLFIHEFRKLYPGALIVPIPGVSAVVTALSVSGFPGNHFEFIGFIPHKKGRQTLFARIAQTEHAVAMYESPHRIIKTLESLVEVLEERPLLIGREMTKAFEEYPVATAKQHLEYYMQHPDKVRGEFVIIVAPRYHDQSTSDTIKA